MPLQRNKPGARLGLGDPLCAVKTDKELENAEYSGHDPKNTDPMRLFERTRHILLNHCEDKDHRVPQQGADPRPIPPDEHTGKRGPVWTAETHKEKQ
jgi:hypothetical protein